MNAPIDTRKKRQQPTHPKEISASSVLTNYLPGFFKFFAGQSPRYIYITEEIDLSDEADAADELYAKWVEMKDAQDYTYPGAYEDEEYVPRRKAWVDFKEKWQGQVRPLIRADRRKALYEVGYGDYSKRKAVEQEWDKIEGDEYNKLHKAMGSPPEVAHQQWRAPTHPFANRIFRISFEESVVEYYNTAGKRSNYALLGLQPIHDLDRLKLMDTPHQIDEEVCEVMRRGIPANIDDEDPILSKTLRLLERWEAGQPGDWTTRMHHEVADSYRQWRDNTHEGLGQPWDETRGGLPLDGIREECIEWLKTNIVAERRRFFETVRQHYVALKKMADDGYYDNPEYQLADGSSIDPAKPLPRILTHLTDDHTGDYTHETYSTEIPLRAMLDIPNLREESEAYLEEMRAHFAGGEAHQKKQGGAFKASDLWGGSEADVPDFTHIATTLIAEEGHKYAQIREGIEENARVRAALTPMDCPKIPHLREDVKLFPHQGLAMAQLDHSEHNAIIDIDMGGGKTVITCIADAMNAVNKGIAKRPCIVMPPGGTTLVPQQVQEIMQKFGEEMNVITVTSQSFHQYGSDDEEKYDSLKERILNAPPNTVLITTFSWLTGDPKVVETGLFTKAGDPKVDKHYWRGSWLVNACGVDMVTLDESHKIKKLGNARNKAICGMSGAPVKRIASGTIFPNTPADIFGQMAFLDPTFFGTWDEFCTKYGLESDGFLSITTFGTDSLKRIRQDLIKYGHMISMRRSYWMSAMPERVEKRHAVRLPKFLQTQYNLIWQEILDQLTNPDNPFFDAKLADLYKDMDSGPGEDEEEGGKESGKLLAKIQLLTQFCTNPLTEIGGSLTQKVPDPNGTGPMKKRPKIEVSRMDKIPAAFLQIRKLIEKQTARNPKSTVSPKVAVCGDILTEHFTTDACKMKDGSVGKVIIFVQHTASAQHFFKWLPSYTGAVSGSEIVLYAPGVGGAPAALKAFKEDPRIKVMVAADKSLYEGHNLQMANRAIRADIHWTPGTTEQVFGRVFRPGSKAEKVFIDTLITEGTGEVAKYGRLLCKYHYMRKINSDYTDDIELDPIGMSPATLSPWMQRTNEATGTTEIVKSEEAILELSQIKQYIRRYDAAYQFDLEESRKLATKMGTDPIAAADGSRVPGYGRIYGEMPDYDEEDSVMPFRFKLYPAKGKAKESIVIDDGWTRDTIIEYDEMDAFGLKSVTRDGSTFLTRPVPTRGGKLKGWIAKVGDSGYRPIEMTVMDKSGKPKRVDEFDYEGGLVGTRGPDERASWDWGDGTSPSEAPEQPVAPGDVPSDSTPDVDVSNEGADTPEVTVEPPEALEVAGGMQVVGVLDRGVRNEGTEEEYHEAYVLYKKPGKGGKSNYVARWHYHDTRDDLAEEIRTEPTEGGKVKGIISSKDGEGVLGIPESVLLKLQSAIVEYDDDVDDSVGWDWKPAAHCPLMGGTPPAPPETSPPVDTSTPEATEDTSDPDRVIEVLRVVSLDGIPYLAVDSAEDDKEAMRPFGFRLFNTFLLGGPFKNVSHVQKLLTFLGNKKVQVKNAEEWEAEARRQIRKQKLKAKKTLGLAQVRSMRKLRKKSKGKITLHVVQTGPERWCGVRSIEPQAALAKVRSIGRFKEQHAGYWSEATTRADAVKVIKKLAKAGYQVANWKSFLVDFEAIYGKTDGLPDLTLVRRPLHKTDPPKPPNSGPVPEDNEEPDTSDTPPPSEPEVQDEPPQPEVEEPPPIEEDVEEPPAEPEVQDEEEDTEEDSAESNLPDVYETLYNRLAEHADNEGMGRREKRKLLRRFDEPDDFRDDYDEGEIDDEEAEEEIERLRQKLAKLGVSEEDPEPPTDLSEVEEDIEEEEEPPPTTSGPVLPKLPIIADERDPLHGVVKKLRGIYNMIDAVEQ